MSLSAMRQVAYALSGLALQLSMVLKFMYLLVLCAACRLRTSTATSMIHVHLFSRNPCCYLFGCRFDISEIAAPYARNLLLEGQPQFAALQKDFGKRWQNQNRAVKNLFRGPNQIEDIAGAYVCRHNSMVHIQGGKLSCSSKICRAQAEVCAADGRR
jgi:hypothetical protein